MKILGVAHVQVPIPPGGEDEARRFYGALLGLVELTKPEALADRGGVWFACGGQELHCGVEAEVVPSKRHVALLTEGLDEFRAALVGSGLHP